MLDGGEGDVAVEVDDCYVGGRGENVGRGCDKQPVIVAVERSWEGGAGRCVARAVPDCSGPSYRLFAEEHLDPRAAVLADGWPGIRAGLATWEGLDQRKFDPDGGDASLPTCHHVISNLKAMCSGTFHGLPPFRLQAFLDEFSWRYSHRCSRDPFADLLTDCLAGHFPRGMLLGAVFEPQPEAPPLPKGNGPWDWGTDLGLCLM